MKFTLASKFGNRVHISLQVWSLGLMYTLASKFGANVHISLKVWSLGLMYTLASKFGANVYISLQFTLATTYIFTVYNCRHEPTYFNHIQASENIICFYLCNSIINNGFRRKPVLALCFIFIINFYKIKVPLLQTNLIVLERNLVILETLSK